jgi:uncharacterized protein (TIGR04255 family)
MDKKYKNSPIVEGVCEFIFEKVPTWDITTPGIIYNEVKTVFPNKETHAVQRVNITTKEPSPKTQIMRFDLARFLSDDKKTLMQLGNDTLTISRLKPYTNWSDFKYYIDYAFNKLNQNVELSSIKRIGLRFVNRIEIPNEKIKLEEYFKFRPSLGDDLQEKEYSSFIVGCIFPMADGRDACKVELNIAVPENKGSSAFMLDLDYSLTKPECLKLNQSLEWVENAHEGIEGLFEGCIKQPLRDLFDTVDRI